MIPRRQSHLRLRPVRVRKVLPSHLVVQRRIESGGLYRRNRLDNPNKGA